MTGLFLQDSPDHAQLDSAARGPLRVARVLGERPKLRPDSQSVVLRELGLTAIVIEVVAFFDTADFAEFTAIRQEVLLEVMGVVEAAGTRLAVPAQRVEVVSDRSPPLAAARPSDVVPRSRDSP